MAKSPEKKETMSLLEACKELGINRSTLYRHISKGLIQPRPKAPGALIRHRVEFDIAEIERFKKSIA